MNDFLFARSQMGMSLAFHIIFAAVGIGMPLLMVIAEGRWLRTRDQVYLTLAKRWAKGTAILFAVGAVSGTVLSFELGLLWPGFMRFAGAIIGMPFSLEGFAFFTEGIFLVIANAWMNTPTGFDLVNGVVAHVNPLAAMANPAAPAQVIHMTLAAYAATGLAVAGIHAFLLLKDPANAFHRRALAIALLVGGPAAVLQPLSGDLAARAVARHQPAKLAAMEALFQIGRGAPLVLGGWPDVAAHTTRYSIRIPYGLSLLAFHDPHAVVKGLDAVPWDEWPNVPAVHWSFQLMVALGTYMAVVALWAGAVVWGKGKGEGGRVLAEHRRLMQAIALATPMGFVATEAGWMATELGRQPWVIYGVLRTRDVVTPMPGLVVPLVVFTLLYCFLGVIVARLLYRQIVRSPNVSETVWAHMTPTRDEGRGKGE